MSLLQDDPVANPRRSTAESHSAAGSPRSGLTFAASTEESGLVADLIAGGYVVGRALNADVPARTTGEAPTRGRLRDAIEAAVEMALAMRGALPPNVSVDAGERAMAEDEVFRVRALGASGLGILLPELRRLVGDDGCLDAADSETLRVWRALADAAPVALLLQDADRGLSLLAPTSLESWLSPSDAGPTAEDVSVCAASDLDFDPDEFILLDDVSSGSVEDSEEDDDLQGMAESIAPRARPTSRDGGRRPIFHANTTDDEDACVMRDDPLADLDDEPAPPDAQQMLPLAVGSRPARASRPSEPAATRDHAAALSAATGVRPVKEIEQLYTTHYAPLLEAVSAGHDAEAAENALATWCSSFEKSYQDSFAAIRVTGKRPKMVLDAPDEAIRVGKMVGARSVQLVLVDGLRFGLGERVQRLLEATMGDIGSCVERQLLWSALPSVTAVQMQLLAHGARGLREIVTPSERDLTAFRDGTACIPRRERIGSRDVLKLDVVEARLRDSGGAYEERMDDLADEVAEALVKIAEGLPPRTMMYVFGDHGFVLRSIADGRTGRAEQGGARPEEVLVPAYAWLIGGLH